MARQPFGQIQVMRSGRFQARYVHPERPWHEDGKRNYINAPTTYRTKTEAKEWLAGIQADIGRKTWKSPEQEKAERLAAEALAAREAKTFASYAADWLEHRKLTRATHRSYESLLKIHLLPYWGETPIKQITSPDVRVWLGVLAPGSPGGRKHAYELFRTIIGTAVDDDLLDHSPCKRNMLAQVKAAPAPSKAKKRRERKPRALTIGQLEALADKVPAYMRLLVLLSGLTGMRAGEVRALRGEDVSRDDNERLWLSIHQAVSGQGNALLVDNPKTPKSIRKIPVPESLAAEVEVLAASAGHALMFHPVGKPKNVIPERTYEINLHRAGERAGIGYVTPHDLRHTAASLARENGASATAIRDLLGHTTTSMTDRYTHTSDEELTRLVDGLDRERERPAGVASLDQRRKQA